MNRLVLLLLVFLTTPAFASQADTTHGIGSDFNGVDWIQWNEVRKFSFVWGFRAGQQSAASTTLETLHIGFNSDSGKKVQERIGIAASVEQIVRGIDTVYADYRNQNLPLWSVCGFVIDSIGGFETDSYLLVLRRTYNKGPVDALESFAPGPGGPK